MVFCGPIESRVTARGEMDILGNQMVQTLFTSGNYVFQDEFIASIHAWFEVQQGEVPHLP